MSDESEGALTEKPGLFLDTHDHDDLIQDLTLADMLYHYEEDVQCLKEDNNQLVLKVDELDKYATLMKSDNLAKSHRVVELESVMSEDLMKAMIFDRVVQRLTISDDALLQNLALAMVASLEELKSTRKDYEKG